MTGLRPLRQTALRDLRDRMPPDPSDFYAFGESSWIVPPARVQGADRIAVGDRSVVMEGSSLCVVDGNQHDHHGMIVIGDDVTLSPCTAVVCELSVVIGDEVSASACVTIFDTWQVPMAPNSSDAAPPPQPVVIGSGAYLGMNSTIGPGVHVGEGAYVAEGATVRSDVPPYSVCVGNPARVVRRLDGAGGWEGSPWP